MENKKYFERVLPLLLIEKLTQSGDETRGVLSGYDPSQAQDTIFGFLN